MSRPSLAVAGIGGLWVVLCLGWSAPAAADGANVMRMRLYVQNHPRTTPSWAQRKLLRPLQQRRQARQEVRRLRQQDPTLERVYQQTFQRVAHQKFSPQTSTLFDFAAAVRQAHKAGRLAVLKTAQDKGIPVLPLATAYLRRQQLAKH